MAVKNLLEEGFDVTGFERSSYIGGLWHFTENEDTLSVLECQSVTVVYALSIRVIGILADSQYRFSNDDQHFNRSRQCRLV